MKKRLLIAGVALVFAGAAWAGGGNCNFGSHENIVGPGLVLTSPHEDPGFFLVEWEIVEDAAFYVVYCEVLQTNEIEPVAKWVRMKQVEAVPDQRQLSTIVELPDDDVNAVFGVAAGITARFLGVQVLSPITKARFLEPAPTAVASMSWAQVKTTASK